MQRIDQRDDAESELVRRRLLSDSTAHTGKMAASIEAAGRLWELKSSPAVNSSLKLNFTPDQTGDGNVTIGDIVIDVRGEQLVTRGI